jgi:hypothetical protein
MNGSRSGDERDRRARPVAPSCAPKAYEPPKILSVEPLEVAAAVCNPPTGGFGKAGPPICGTLGS